MRCLTDAELQGLADGEADAESWPHLDECRQCRDRLEAARATTSHVVSVVNSAGEMPPQARARVRQAIVAGAWPRGATRLRESTGSGWRRPALISALATAAVILLMVFGVLPRFGAPTTLSASEVLTRSLQTLSTTEGIEFVEYELVADGIAHGSWRIEQLIDHAEPARFRISVFAGDGSLQSAFSQEPALQKRSHLARVDGRNYVVRANGVRRPVLSLPQMGQALVETAIGMMQASADQHLSVVERADGRHYIVEMPPVVATNTASTLDLHRARTVVSDGDFRIEEFEASGTLLRQPFTISFRLLRRVVGREISLPDFTIQPGPDDVVMNGEASDDPGMEFLTTIVRGLTTGQAAR